MGKNNLDINISKLGMDKDSHPSSLREQSYTHAENANIESNSGDGSIMLQNEHSNILCYKFDEGFKVVGFENDVNSDSTYFMLTNPVTKVSEIGYIKNNQTVVNIEDVESRCGCGIIKNLSLPLEELAQYSTCNFITLLEDSCNKCLNFNINYPIHNIKIKDEQSGKVLYWTEGLNPQRQLNLSKISEYKKTGNSSCGEGEEIDICVDCEKLRIFKLFNKPCLEPEVIQVGGNLKAGVYEVIIAYSDSEGNELSDYFSITNPIAIFDQNNQILDQPSQDYRTNFGIRLSISDLDHRFDYYKVVFIQTTGLNREVSQFVEGVHSTSESSIFITNELNKDRISIERLVSIKPFYETASGMTSSNGYLFQFGLKAERELNLQPVVSILGSLVHWQSSVANNKIYENGVLASKATGFMRDEVYPLSIRFSRTSGKDTALFPFIGRPIVEGVEDVVVDNTDTQSVNEFNTQCVESNRTKRYEFYNTASELGECSMFSQNYNCFSAPRTLYCSTINPVNTIDSKVFNITDVGDFSTMEDYLRVYSSEICNVANSKYDADLCGLLTDTFDEICIPDEISATALVTVSGTGGTASVVINGNAYVMTFNTDIDTTINDFVEHINSITFAGVSGTMYIVINGEKYLATFNTDLATTVNDFVATHAATILTAHDVVVSSGGGAVLEVTYYDPTTTVSVAEVSGLTGTESMSGNGYSILSAEEALVYNNGGGILRVEYRNYQADVTISNLTGDLTGTVVTTGTVDTGVDCPEGCVDSSDPISTELVVDISLESTVYNEKSEADYDKGEAAIVCSQHKLDSNGDVIRDTTFEGNTGLTTVYERNDNLILEACSPASFVPNLGGLGTPLRLNYYSDAVQANLEDASNAAITDANLEFPASPTSFPLVPSLAGITFAGQLHKGAIWLEFSFDEGEDISILEISKKSACQNVDDMTNTIVRLTAYDSCSSGVPIMSTAVDLTNGGLMRLDRSLFSSNTIRIAIDAPIAGGVFPNDYYIDAPCGCFNAYKRPVEYSSVDVTISADVFRNIEYSAVCYFKVPKANPDCDPLPYKYGKFAYVESTSTYPDNAELYDSSTLVIDEVDLARLSDEDVTELKSHYSSNGVGNFILDTTKTNFRCTPIRHFKFPDNNVSPFMSTDSVDSFSEPIIYPLGITIDDNAIAAFLDIAVKNELITQAERDSITGYEIFRGDRVLDKSIIAKGYLFDMYKYQDDGGDEIHYSNFPYNDLGRNRLSFEDSSRTFYLPHPYSGDSNNRFTFHSPDTHFIKPTIPSEVRLEGFVFGNSKGKFELVEDHSKMSVLGSLAYSTATALAIAETLAELTLISAQVASDLAGVSLGGVVSAAIAIAAVISLTAESFVRTGKYRYQWLQTFSDLGNLTNYANYYTSVGYYNKFTPHDDESNMLRGIAASGYLKSGRALIKEEDSGAEVRINNLKRESSVYLSTGINSSYRFTYPSYYKNYDNAQNINSRNSRVVASDIEGACDNNSKEFIRDIASPYVSLKNYLPSQYGDINSVRWLSTGHCGRLNDLVKNASVVLTGTSGTAELTICGEVYVISFDTNIETTIDSFLVNELETIQNVTNADAYKSGTDTIIIEYPSDCDNISLNNTTGDLNGVVTINTNVCNSIFGGDTFISWMSLKRKIPMFTTDMMGLGDNIPFNYYFYRNIAHTRFYIDYLTTEDNSFSLSNVVFPTIDSVVETDCENETGKFFLPNDAKFYLYYYGIPQFLVESTINLNMRYAKEDREDHFYPQSGDYVDWTQEKNVSISKDNTYYYNSIYSKQVTTVGTKILPVTYSKEYYDVFNDQENGIIYSEQDSTEQNLTDPWLVYKPLNFHQFPTSYGRLISLDDIESLQILGRFENQMVVYNAVDTLRERLTPANKELGIGGIFATRPISFNRTTLGYAGTQHRALVSCEFGHFFVDALRGQVFQLTQNAKGLIEVSAFTSSGEASGMRNWFKENLPFKILRGGVTGLTIRDVDNAFKGLGITMGWDSRFRRVFITKRDYVVKEEYKNKLVYRDGVFYFGKNPVFLTDKNVFEDCSWTIAYSPITQRWVSFYSFKPNYYISHNNYFQTGINYATDSSELGLWSHLLTNRSYQVFYGKKYPWTIELPITNKFVGQKLKSIEYYLDSKRFHNEYDFAENRKIGFNKAVIYNNSQNSGELNLIVEDLMDMTQLDKYPKINTASRDVLVTENEMRWTFNDFYNQVRNELSNVPNWITQSNGVDKNINRDAISYRKEEEMLIGDWFLVRLTQDASSQHKIIFKSMISLTNLYRR